MALVVEDGTAKTDAESYISVADADTYFSNRGNATWAAIATTAAKEQALRKATDYLEAEYGQRWKGEKYTAAQALSWPRNGATFSGYTIAASEIPVVLVRACAELAVRASAEDLRADQASQVKSETVGPISVTFADSARQGTRYAAIEAMLAGLLQAGGGVPVARA